MRILIIYFLCFLVCSDAQAGASQDWLLDHSTLIYTVNHPLKTTTGKSTSAKGKGRCENGKCEFLIGVPVKTFESGDTNRDLHMVQVTQGATYPMITVQTSFPDATVAGQAKAALTFNVKFAGKEANYADVPFVIDHPDDHAVHVTGVLTIKLSDFSISPPSLLTFPIKDEVPIHVDAYWIIKK